MGRSDSPFALSFPAAAPASAHWTERVVTQGHADYCAAHGHATWTEDGVVLPRCPRCGELRSSDSVAAESVKSSTEDYRPEVVAGARVRMLGTGRLANRSTAATVVERDGRSVKLQLSVSVVIVDISRIK